ncbi:hypothetical protein I7I50_00040 [Histoplasma capsulatum G186AR]|uniref:Uncharacterized protein n=1 Tax=Ajellomyces capsulatus TaxID=5037 RepID=A0A8H7YDC8_AJECA|nr:hypothetical protein I7I52_07309 [Histoplasma capsulatum]QSS72246.1 hypothetical protein I7I50_00040 [Histoplasma capsulatum G186AR]
MTTATPAMVQTIALFSEAHVEMRSQTEDDGCAWREGVLKAAALCDGTGRILSDDILDVVDANWDIRAPEGDYKISIGLLCETAIDEE